MMHNYAHDSFIFTVFFISSNELLLVCCMFCKLTYMLLSIAALLFSSVPFGIGVLILLLISHCDLTELLRGKSLALL
jgi:hypothetical protein